MFRTYLADLCLISLASLIASPANADGGISSLGGMLPVLLSLWVAGLGLFVWLSYSVYLLYRIRATGGRVDPKVYTTLSVVLICLVLLLGTFLSMLNPIFMLGALLSSIIVGATAILIVSRARDTR